MDWTYQARRGVGIIELHGFLGDSVLARFSGAVGWALARGAGPVVVDLTRLQGCSATGKAALEGAAGRAGAAGRKFAVCCPHGNDTLNARHREQAAMPVYANLDTAVAALSPERPENLP
jgi:anti-anti-sigma regulatory factor